MEIKQFLNLLKRGKRMILELDAEVRIKHTYEINNTNEFPGYVDSMVKFGGESANIASITEFRGETIVTLNVDKELHYWNIKWLVPVRENDKTLEDEYKPQETKTIHEIESPIDVKIIQKEE